MLSIIPIVKKSIDDGVSIELFTAWIKNFFCGKKSPTNYDKYNSKATSGSGHAESVRSRLEVINKDYKKFIKEHENDNFEKVEESVEEKVEEVVVETTETIEEVVAEETVETVETEKEIETVEVTPEMVEETETTETETETTDTFDISDEDEIPENIRAILEAANFTEEELEEAV
jgi:hypothetical protein